MFTPSTIRVHNRKSAPSCRAAANGSGALRGPAAPPDSARPPGVVLFGAAALTRSESISCGGARGADGSLRAFAVWSRLEEAAPLVFVGPDSSTAREAISGGRASGDEASVALPFSGVGRSSALTSSARGFHRPDAPIAAVSSPEVAAALDADVRAKVAAAAANGRPHRGRKRVAVPVRITPRPLVDAAAISGDGAP